MSFASHLRIAFGDDEPPAGPPPGAPPANELPGCVANGPVLLRTADAALSLSMLRTYSTGLEIELELRLRPSAPGLPDERDLWDTVAQLRLGVEIADGTRVVRDAQADPARAGIGLASVAGSGAGNAYRLSFWLSQVPPPGDLLLVTAHPLFGPVEGQHLVPAAALAAASDRIVELWPWEPERDEPVRRQPEPPPLPGGWFAYATG